jgi:hypothetical protein
MAKMSRKRALKIADCQEKSMAMSLSADHIIIHPIVHRAPLFDVMGLSLVGAAPLTGRIMQSVLRC